MNLRRIFANAIARRVAYLVVASVVALLAGMFGISEAKAQQQDPMTYGNQGAAYAGCIAAARSTAAYKDPGFSGYFGAPRCESLSIGSPWSSYTCNVTRYNSSGSIGMLTQTCSAASNTNYATKHQWGVGKMCADRPPFQAGVVGSTISSNQLCDAGCVVAPASDTMKLRVDSRDTSIFTAIGNYAPTGAVCDAGLSTAPPARGPPRDEFCSELEGGGYQLCPQKDGKICVKSNKTGRKYCGNNDYPTASTDPNRTEGVGISALTPSPGSPAPEPVPRQGETFAPVSTGSVTNTTTNTTTNVTNYNNTGTPNTSGGSGTPGDGSDNPGEPGDGEEGPGEGGTIGGDGVCGGTFTCAGGDAVLCAIAQQTYAARCEADGRLGGDVGDFGDAGEGVDPDPAESLREVTLGVGFLDDGGFLGGGSCPSFGTLSTSYGTYNFDDNEHFCKVLAVARGAFIFLGAFLALGILMGGKGQ